MTNPGKGGRGKQAPYSTVHYRIPKPIKLTVEQFASAYRILAGSENLEGCKNLIYSVDNAVTNLGESEQKIKDLEAELVAAKSQIEAMKTEITKVSTNLQTASQLKSREGTKMKEIIKESINSLKAYLGPSIQ